MAEITGMPPVTGVLPLEMAAEDSGESRQEYPGPLPRAEGLPAAPRPREGVGDVAFVMGIPSGELTPRVREALAIILGEFDRQRAERDRLAGEARRLAGEADRDPVLPLPGRRAFLREARRILGQAGRALTANALVCLHLANGDRVCLDHGRGTVERLLIAVAESVAGRLGPADLAGSLGGHCLAAVFTFDDAAAVAPAMAALEADLGGLALDLPPDTVRAEVHIGVHLFRPGEGIDAILDAAEADLRRRRGR